MNTLNKLVILVLLFILAGTRIGFGQRFDYNDKMYFADSVKSVKLWTYIEGDTSFRRYRDAVQSASNMLNKKGYLVELVKYDPGTGYTAQQWMNNVIMGLRKNEAFLQISTRISKSDALTPALSPQTRVLNDNGAVIIDLQQPVNYDSVKVNYFSKASSHLYVNWNIASRTALVPVYSKIQNEQTADVSLAVKYSLAGIPVCKHPGSSWISTDTVNKNNIPIEFWFFGGFTFPSKMNVIDSGGLYTSKFNANVPYGLEIAFRIFKHFDLNMQFRRLGTVVDLNTIIHNRLGSVIIYQNFMLFGTNYHFRVNKLISPYVGISLGGVDLDPAGDYYRSIWYFAVGAQGGVKFYLSKRIGLRLQADFGYQVHPISASFLYSDDVFHNVPVYAMTNMLQVSITGGLIFRLGN